ncbi:hypothetical protein [Georgenia daeguensis]|uniref:Helix-turn-helix domain-containing protein n=1 Tax=Georgenia daeguensis TaxID=908355 RepID=A0ABP8EYH9_9MICO
MSATVNNGALQGFASPDGCDEGKAAIGRLSPTSQRQVVEEFGIAREAVARAVRWDRPPRCKARPSHAGEWAKDPKIGSKMSNARSETTITEKPSNDAEPVVDVQAGDERLGTGERADDRPADDFYGVAVTFR